MRVCCWPSERIVQSPSSTSTGMSYTTSPIYDQVVINTEAKLGDTITAGFADGRTDLGGATIQIGQAEVEQDEIGRIGRR